MLQTKTCDYCGEDFQAKRRNARFCSTEHRVAWHRAEKQKAKRQQFITEVLNGIEARAIREINGLRSYANWHGRKHEIEERLQNIKHEIDSILA
jgi:hypothetical protein